MSIVQTGLMTVGIAVFNFIAWMPILLSTNVRSLLRTPFENLLANYLVWSTAYSLVHLALLVSTTVLSGGISGIAVFQGLAGVTAGTAILSFLIAAIGLPWVDRWDPKLDDEELDGRIALGIGLLWYLLLTGAALFLFLIISIALFYPG